MARKVLSVSMSAGMLKSLRERIAEDDEFKSVSDYVRELIKNDKTRAECKAAIGWNFEKMLFPKTTWSKRLRWPE